MCTYSRFGVCVYFRTCCSRAELTCLLLQPLMHNCTMRVTMLLCGHCDNSRYYHLQKGGATAQLGQIVAAGAAIARSGNTGYSDTPHLHFDMVDLLPEDCCSLTITTTAAAEAAAGATQQSVNMTIAAVPALFSGLITAAGTGSCLLVSADDVTELPQWQQPATLLLHRSGVRTFAEDIDAALDLCQVRCPTDHLSCNEIFEWLNNHSHAIHI
jgi:Peptidase family M23